MNMLYSVTVDANNRYHIEMSADISILPNKYVKLSNWYNVKYHVEPLKTICEDFINEVARLNNITVDENTKLIETWIHNPDICDNFYVHNPRVEHNNKRISVQILIDRIPYDILRDKKEGDVFKYTYPITGEKIEGTVSLLLTCRQIDYNYRRSCNFEQALEETLI
jgi:hypothetical protein